MDVTTITFKDGQEVEFKNKTPEFYNADGVDFVGVGIGAEQIAFYPRRDVARVTVIDEPQR